MAGVLLLLAAGCGDADPEVRPPEPTGTPSVTWGTTEGEPGCTWQPARRQVSVVLRLSGTDVAATELTVTVTAHADENTSQPVGSGTRTVQVRGTVDRTLRLAFPVTAEPYVDIDGVTACSLDVGP